MRKVLTLMCALAACMICQAQVNPNPNFNKVMLKGQVALITDMSQAMEYVWTPGDIDTETLKKGCFVQVLGDYYITDGNNGYFRTTSNNGTWGYDSDWADFESTSVPKGSLAKYGPSYVYTYKLEAVDYEKIQYASESVVYFKYDPSTKILYSSKLRNYLGHYDWHDFYLQGYARTFNGVYPYTGYYDWQQAQNDPLSRYLYDSRNPSEWCDSIPLFFSENPYQIDGPCILMYKGKPWSLKLTGVETLDETNAQIRYAEEGTEWVWDYQTDPKGDTIKLQAGVYIFFLSYYNQKDNAPLTFTAQRCDLGQFDIIGNDTLMPAQSYTEIIDDEPKTPTIGQTDPGQTNPGQTNPGQVNPGQGTNGQVVLSSFYSYTTKETKYKYKNYTTPYGTSRKKVSYYEYHTHSSEIHLEYPVAGLAEELGYTGCVAIPYGAFNENTNHTNTAKLIDGQAEFKVTAEKEKGVPVVVYNTSTHNIDVTYITYDKYKTIKASVRSLLYAAPGQIYNLMGVKVDEADMRDGEIYIRDGKKTLKR